MGSYTLKKLVVMTMLKETIFIRLKIIIIITIKIKFVERYCKNSFIISVFI